MQGKFSAAAAGLVAAVVLSGTLAGCSSDDGGDDGRVTITVQGMPTKSDPAGRKAFLNQIAQFERENPKIKVVGSDAQWDPQTFAAKLAGGSADTVIRVPLTEPQGLIARRQVRDITDDVKTWPQYSQYNQKLQAPNMDAASRIYGLTEPETAYAMGLVYNRALFTKAGLDPDQPPTTWEGVRSAAKAIHDKTDAIGYAETTTNNTGGWHLTSYTYSRGGTMEREQGGKMVPAFTEQPTRDALQLLHDMRFVDDSMGSNQLQTQADVQRRFAAGQVGMYIDGPGAYVPIVQKYGGSKEDLGVASLPQDGGNATQLGATVAMVSAKSDKARTAAAVKWILFEYIKPFYDPQAARARAEQSSADPEKLVGAPAVAAFPEEVEKQVDAAIKPYINIPVQNFEPYRTGSAGLRLLPEPPVAAQKVYAALDPVVQAVLTKQDADIGGLLKKAADQVSVELERAQ
ncbi:extracellular solute-binding protein [Nonomuraea sp. NPDC046570]|uniref:extracellular solute-binding protein n=1 Tax=Nonomuraea sp. NPDC046570 TaxID=3155255 RepID=UPI00340411D7